MNGNRIAKAARRSVDGSGSSHSVHCMAWSTAFLLALGLGAAGSGAFLLWSTPTTGTAQALARVEGTATHASMATTHASMATTHASMATTHASMAAVHALDTTTHASHTEWQPVTSVEVRASIPGRVAAVRSEPGAYVRKGDTLLVIDPTPFVGALERAHAAVAAARARLGAATVELGRAQRAFDDGAIDEGLLDARVRMQRDAHGTLRAAAEALELAQRDLARTRIAAPIGGRVHEVRVRVGDRVAAAPDGGVLVTIVAPGAVYADAGTPTWDTGRRLADPRTHRAIARGSTPGRRNG